MRSKKSKKLKVDIRLSEALKWCEEHKVKRSREVIALLTVIIKEHRRAK